MNSKCMASVLVVCGLGFLSGCPAASDFGFGFGSGYEVIPDGTYAGDANSSFEAWYQSTRYVQESGGSETSATFVRGTVLKNSGQLLAIGDVEQLGSGSFAASRQVYDVQIGEWECLISYDVSARWNGIPMSGTEFISFSGNSDGSITMFDTLELNSLEEIDGGSWTFHAHSSGTLYPVYDSDTPSGGLHNPILDLKSGRMILTDPASH